MQKESKMLRSPLKRFAALAVTGSVVLVVGAGPAGASTTVAWNATLTEPIGGPLHWPFECGPYSACSAGSGEVIGLGHVQDLVVFGACGDPCDVRTLTFTDGSTIVMNEVFLNEQNPGNSNHPTPRSRAKYGNPLSGDLNDTIVGGTGRFAAATGVASGTVNVAGAIATARLSGTVSF
jgi:hypothetical protein